jgi:hypothetical protein
MSMRVVVKFHQNARKDYDEWQTRLSQPPTGNAGIARMNAEEMVRQFEKSNGIPSGAKLRAERDPQVWEWRFSSDTWIQFICRKRRQGLWGGASLEVIVTAITNQPLG